MAEAGRVITGSAGGIRLLAPGEGTRPISDKVKQSLFASLEAELEDPWSDAMLDLFAGSGAAGIEALSRGAPRAVLVEHDAGAARTIAENLRRTRVEGGTVVKADALRYLGAGSDAAPTGAGGPFLVVIADPPYAATSLLASALVLLGDPALGWLRDDAVVIAKHFWKEPPPPDAGRLHAVRDRRFGETALRWYRVEDVPA
ncbi:MAG: RsmD family RNA methyltransferase [Chloroflexota bacterium]